MARKVEEYLLLDEPDKTMYIFENLGKFYGHIIKNRTDKAPAKFVFETPKFDSLEDLKKEYPRA